MGLEGEYDPCGLARRLAHALDQDAQLAQVKTLTLAQQGNSLALAGDIGSRQALEKIVTIARHLDGAHSVDVSQVQVDSNSDAKSDFETS
jgi:Tfp pilus assembly protein PilN